MHFFKKRLDTQSKVLLKNSSWVFFSNLFSTGLAFLRGIVIARGLGAELFGIYTVAVAFIATVQEIFNLNLGAAVIRFGSQYLSAGRNDKVVSILKLSLISSAIASAVAFIAVAVLTALKYDSFIKQPGLTWFVLLYTVAASSIFFNQVSRGALRLFFRFKTNAIIQMIMDIAEFALIVSALFFYPGNLSVFMIAIIVSRFINGVVPNIAGFRELGPQLRSSAGAGIKLIKDQFSEIRKFVITNSITKTLQSLINTGDVLILGVFTSSPVQAAYYAVGKKLAYSLLTLTDPLVTSIYPQLCKLRDENKIKEISNMLFRLTALAAIPSALFLVIAFSLGDWIMKVVFGAEYAAAGPVFSILTAAALINAVFFWIQPLLQAIDLLGMRLLTYATGIVIGLGAALFLVPRYGAEGMAFAIIAMNLVMPAMFLYFAIKKLRSESLFQHASNKPADHAEED
ncbi:MAG TPA: oligosaccharide flippase family protein [Bacteroidia bacterium]|nr:oligosaccharide flippase family protein [Bacteroidia bacterium]